MFNWNQNHLIKSQGKPYATATIIEWGAGTLTFMGFFVVGTFPTVSLDR